MLWNDRRSISLIRLQQRAFFGFLADPFGRSVHSIELDGNHIRITRRGQVAAVPLQTMTSAPSLRKGMLGTALTIRSVGDHGVTLKGAGHRDALDFSEVVRTAWTRFNLSVLKKEEARLDRILAEVLSLAAPSRYPAACRIAPLLHDARDLDASLLSKLNAEAIRPDAVARIAPVRKFAADPRMARSNAVAAFVTAELDRWREFFDTIESKPLTPEQPVGANLASKSPY